ncbi:hypothetical protein SKAU_G00045400 [Synaphobranchus kaupii]|uniref:Uncharacterized protein n=1 Tax=Synaphobranchus kaupii TaxID=118154 RepID=A0A9Q1G232_SYNKA|nr:hypothetical protein SKAU_G00045400 [Synaphobranchus kaupii]
MSPEIRIATKTPTDSRDCGIRSRQLLFPNVVPRNPVKKDCQEERDGHQRRDYRSSYPGISGFRHAPERRRDPPSVPLALSCEILGKCSVHGAGRGCCKPANLSVFVSVFFTCRLILTFQELILPIVSTTFCAREENVEDVDVSGLQEEALRNIVADSLWSICKLLDGIQVQASPLCPPAQ